MNSLNRCNYRSRASSRRSFLFVIPISKMLLRASTPSICLPTKTKNSLAFALLLENDKVTTKQRITEAQRARHSACKIHIILKRISSATSQTHLVPQTCIIRFETLREQTNWFWKYQFCKHFANERRLQGLAVHKLKPSG